MKVKRLRWWKIKNGGVHVSWMTLSRHHKARASNAPRKRLKHVRTDHQSFCQQPKSKLTETDSISSCYSVIIKLPKPPSLVQAGSLVETGRAEKGNDPETQNPPHLLLSSFIPVPLPDYWLCHDIIIILLKKEKAFILYIIISPCVRAVSNGISRGLKWNHK